MPGWRVVFVCANKALVAALPLPTGTAFRLWTLAAGLATVLLLCRFLERRGIRTETAVLVTILFVFGAIIFVLWIGTRSAGASVSVAGNSTGMRMVKVEPFGTFITSAP